uniref:Uncharacterized protein n=1 Tax=viral metagenome TaxID=1070528 RepID=A0A6C0E2A7_9ZZZZ
MSMLKPNTLVLTRYLYIKDEVEAALLVSLLEQDREQSLFWAYELYYSGFCEELFEFLWIIYFDFFASLNPSFEVYFLKKEKEWKQESNAIFVAIIIENLLIRPFNSDVYILRNSQYSKSDPVSDNLKKWIKNNDYSSLANFILHINNSESLEQIYDKTINEFESIYGDLQKEKRIKQFKSIVKRKQTLSKHILLSRVMSLFINNTPKGRNLYMHVEPCEIVLYETCDDPEIKPYRLLNKVCLFGTNDHAQLHLFSLARALVKNLTELYHNDWLFYASFSPIWLSRIQQHGGSCEYEATKVIFQNEDQEELFYNKYNYETDEQSMELKQKTIPEIGLEQPTDILCHFQNKYNKNGLTIIYKN